MTINSTTDTIIPMAKPGIPFDFTTALEVVLDASLLAEGVTDGAEGVAVDWTDGVVRTIAGVLVGEGVEEEDVIDDVWSGSSAGLVAVVAGVVLVLVLVVLSPVSAPTPGYGGNDIPGISMEGNATPSFEP
jgi:hypothetical protein